MIRMSPRKKEGCKKRLQICNKKQDHKHNSLGSKQNILTKIVQITIQQSSLSLPAPTEQVNQSTIWTITIKLYKLVHDSSERRMSLCQEFTLKTVHKEENRDQIRRNTKQIMMRCKVKK